MRARLLLPLRPPLYEGQRLCQLGFVLLVLPVHLHVHPALTANVAALTANIAAAPMETTVAASPPRDSSAVVLKWLCSGHGFFRNHNW